MSFFRITVLGPSLVAAGRHWRPRVCHKRLQVCLQRLLFHHRPPEPSAVAAAPSAAAAGLPLAAVGLPLAFMGPSLACTGLSLATSDQSLVFGSVVGVHGAVAGSHWPVIEIVAVLIKTKTTSIFKKKSSG